MKNYLLCDTLLYRCDYFLLPKRKPKPQFLSQDEYIHQTMIETPKALIELHKYCNSPNYNVWKVISRLREPKK